MKRTPFAFAIVFFAFLPAQLLAQSLQTAAEKSNFTATSRHSDVIDFCERLAKQSPLIRLGELGKSAEGRSLPLVILADPPIATPEEAQRSKKLVVFAMANIHAGEVDGKEALLMLARDLAAASERPLLKNLVLVFAPIFNADGNEKISKDNRRTQNGPTEGVGTRTNAQGLDLNRDFVKVESPEVRALVLLLNRWDPAIVIDCHTTDGSYHRYALTYEGGRCPAGDENLITFVRDEMLQDVGKRLKKATGYSTYFYGNFSTDRSRWETVTPTPRYGTHYVGLRNRIAILSESYTYAPFKDRVLASRGFVQSILEYSADNKPKIEKLLSAARQSTVQAGKERSGSSKLIVRHRDAPVGPEHRLLGFVEETKDGRRRPTQQHQEYPVQYWGGSESVKSVSRPAAYLIPAQFSKVTENLQRHGLEVDELREDIELDVEVCRVQKVTRADLFQQHATVTIEVQPRKETRRLPAGTIMVRMAQALGSLAGYLLEPESMDGLTTWNFFDSALREGQDHPVVRLLEAAPLNAGRVRPLPEERARNKPISFEAANSGFRSLSFTGTPIADPTWLADGKHFLQTKEGKLFKVDAATGRATLFHDPEKLLASLSKLSTIDKQTAGNLARSQSLRMNPARTAFLFTHEADLYHAHLDGSGAVRLTKSSGTKELVSFSPNGQWVAFVRGNNLHVVDVASQTELALTSDGTNLILNGKADWVYGEEIFDRGHQSYWWSPDSTQIAFMQYDDTPVHRFTVVDQMTARQSVESTPYPKAGDPNPLVKLGIVAAAGGPVRWVKLGDYPATSTLLVRAGWLPDSQHAYFYVQDRAQTWLDFCMVPREGGEAKRLFRETTKAWVEDPGAPTYLKDGSFLLPSARTGYRHLHHFSADGQWKCAVTNGDWEVRSLHRVDEQAGWIYFSGTRDSTIATNLYRIKLDGTDLQRLTLADGDHRISLSPQCNLFVDFSSNHQTPTQSKLYQSDGKLVRVLDTNPVYAREEYQFGQYELVQIKTPDGFLLEGSILKPPHFDPKKKYPVWYQTYAGPQMPTMRNSWMGGRISDEVKAHAGFIAFRCDPRSASGKSAASAWTAYRQLGVQELKDIEVAIRWLSSQSYVDPARIGMSGHSYGGFMTAFALTHSKLFAAGVAGAPVTDWRNYDSIYTERYMNTPQQNPDGYNASSVVRAARNLHGKLLLIHGLVDDNVHVQNTMQLVDALQRADKDFEVMLYPRSRHGIGGRHYQRLIYDFMRRTLKPEPAPNASTVPMQ